MRSTPTKGNKTVKKEVSMMLRIVIAVVFCLLISSQIGAFFGGGKAVSVMGKNGQVAKSIFDFEVDGISGRVDLEQYKGKNAYLCVNLASK